MLVADKVLCEVVLGLLFILLAETTCNLIRFFLSVEYSAFKNCI